MQLPIKPKLVYFQHRYDEHVPAFVLLHTHEHVKCLMQFFDVTVVNHDCDYQQICDRYEPDLALFESGVPYLSSKRPRIENARSNGRVPKLGLLHSDAFSEQRSGFLSDMEHWGIETFFAIATKAAEHTPQIADRLFVWPNSVDSDTFRDYGQWKTIPVLLTGNHGPLYPWRQAISDKIAKRYPHLRCPHGGYEPNAVTAQLMVGESYARALNASCCVPTCGTAAKEVVRKHLEIPACKSCLITEPSAALQAAGFVDMTNCVLADANNILDKLEYLFQHRDTLEEISTAGYELVHSRHTMKQRDQILQWYVLHRSLRPQQQIVQRNPFDPLTAVDRTPGSVESHVVCDGALTQLTRQGDRKLWEGKYNDAESLYLRCLSYYQWMPEPQLKLALCRLYMGDAAGAIEWIGKPIRFTLDEYNAADPDPVEWAYFIVALLCSGRIKDAKRQSERFEELRHPELDRARWAVQAIDGTEERWVPSYEGCTGGRASVHQMPVRSFSEWGDELCQMLVACGRRSQAEVLKRRIGEETRVPHGAPGCRRSDDPPDSQGHPNRRNGSGFHSGWLARRGRDGRTVAMKTYRNARTTARRTLRELMHGAERRVGFFLPHRLSASKNDEYFASIRQLGQDDDLRAALIIGSTVSSRNTQALLAGALENKNTPHVFCVNRPRLWLMSGTQGRRALYPFVTCYELSRSRSSEESSRELSAILEEIRDTKPRECVDMVVIDGAGLDRTRSRIERLIAEVRGAKLLVLEHASATYCQGGLGMLLRDAGYVLISQNLTLRDGYAIFQRAFD
jgi:tetratricopeptide (TPR) repeat protein